MTQQRASELLAMIKVEEQSELTVNSWWGSFAKDYKEALQMAIRALEQQPCEDCISKQDALNCVTSNEFRYRIVEDIKALPSVTPKSKSEYEHDHEVVKAYNDGQANILDKIRAEIEDIPNNPITKPVGTYDYVMGATNERRIILEIIDKYRGE